MESLSLSVPIASKSRAVVSASSATSMLSANDGVPVPTVGRYGLVSGPLMIPRRRVMSYLRNQVVCMAPEEKKMTRRSPLDFPIEWERPKPGRRPDIFPQFSPMRTPLPPPLPADLGKKMRKKKRRKRKKRILRRSLIGQNSSLGCRLE